MDKIMKFDKPFKTLDEQIEILKSRNITINNVTFAKSVLNSLSYYTIINGYKNSFISIPGTDSFLEGTHFEDLYTLHIIDNGLSSIIFKNILYVERYLKTRISYLISEKYGVYTDFHDMSNSNSDDYLCRDNYSRSNGKRTSILRSIKESINSPRKNHIMEHYLDTKNHIPPWITVTNIPFGLTIEWYNILQSDDKTKICEQFISSPNISLESKKEFIKKAFLLLKEFRNNIAHGNRTFNAHTSSVLPVSQLLTLSKGIIKRSEYNSRLGQNDLFATILSILILIDDPYILTNFYADIAHILLPYKSASIAKKSVLNNFHLPDDLLDRINTFLAQ